MHLRSRSGKPQSQGVILPMNSTKFIEKAWEALGEIERYSEKSMASDLSGWEEIVRRCVEAGGIAATLPAKNQKEMRIIAAAPFLKRALTDLRAIWILIKTGYTSQAASIAASLYENSLVAAVVAESPELADEAKATKYAEIPWPPKKLAQLDAKRALKVAYKGAKYPDKEYIDSWTISYYNYKWLCQIKHPTWQSAFHDLKSSSVSKDSYALFPFPSNFEEDIHMKYSILGVSVSKALEAVKSFFLSLECDESHPGYDDVEAKINISHFGVLKQMKKYEGRPSPVSVLDRRFVKTDFSTLVDKYGGSI
jgi:hypothetical protein